MAYNKKTWINDEIITKEAMNNLENGIADLDNRVSNLQLGSTTGNSLSRYIDPNSFDNLQSAIDYAKENNKKIVADKIILNQNVNFRGVELDINVLDIGTYTLELGGYYSPDVNGQATTNPPQSINKILLNMSNANKDVPQVFVRGAVGQHIKIGQCYGNINLRMNMTDEYIAYSTFDFGFVKGVLIGNDESVPASPGKALWCNENVFYINRCNKFVIDGTYQHDLNRIYGGCFEGVASIDIRIGRYNAFYDIRLEGSNSVTINFGEKTCGNTVYRHDRYYIDVTDLGTENAVVLNNQTHYRMINNYCIKADTFNENYMNGFKNLVKTTDNKGIKPTSDALAVLLETEFIENNKNIMFMASCSRKAGNGMSVSYKIYDGNFQEITDVNQSFYMITTTEEAITEQTEGTYFAPNGQGGNSELCDKGIYNDKIIILPTVFFSTSAAKDRIKYIKFFIRSSSYFAPGAEYYDLSASIYDMSGDFFKTFH